MDVLGVGTTANDGTGEPLRTAMQKINGNFAELVQFSRGFRGLHTYTTDHAMIVDDVGSIVEMNKATGITFTISANADLNIPVPAFLWIVQAGVGGVTVSPGVGVVIHGTATLAAQWKMAMLYQRAIDEWVMVILN